MFYFAATQLYLVLVLQRRNFLYFSKMEKEVFFNEEYITLIKKLKSNQKPQWGVLSAQGMVEHMTDSFGVAWGRIVQPLQTPVEFLEKAKSFAMSDKPFKPLTKNSLMNETPASLRHENIKDAVKELENEIFLFTTHYQFNSGAIVTNPFYGDFNYREWLHLLHKHAVHHLKQFLVIN